MNMNTNLVKTSRQSILKSTMIEDWETKNNRNKKKNKHDRSNRGNKRNW